MIDFLRKLSRSTAIRIALISIVMTGAGTAAASVAQAQADDEEIYKFKCHTSQQGCEHGTHFYCDGGCGANGCKCTHWDYVV